MEIEIKNNKMNSVDKLNMIKHFENDEKPQQIKKNMIWCISEILSYVSFIVRENEMVLDTRYFVLIASPETYNIILESVICKIVKILENYQTVIVHLNMKTFTLTHVDKHYSFIKNICILLQERFPDKLEKCFVYNATFLFSQLFKIVSKFIDKKTQKKIELVKD